MKSIYKVFKDNVRSITRYYLLLVEETKSQRLVGSTNEWVLDNYYMISEQEKVLKEELQSRGFRQVGAKRLQVLSDLLKGFLERCHYQVDKALLFRYLSQVQQSQKDFLTYLEVYALLPLCKCVLIAELASLCEEMRLVGAFHYSPTDKQRTNLEYLDAEGKRNLLMMNIFNSLKKMTKLPMAELTDAVSFSERMLKAEKAGMYDQMQDKTKEDYRNRIVRLTRKGVMRDGEGHAMSEYEIVRQLVDQANCGGGEVSGGEPIHVGWALFPPKRWEVRARIYVVIVALISVALAVGFGGLAAGFTGWMWVVLSLLMVVPMSQVVIDLFNQVLYRLHKPVGTFKLKFKEGKIPREYATMVIMPTLLKSAQRTEELLDQLEVYYLSNIDRGQGRQSFRGDQRQNLYYTLVGDAAAYNSEDAPWDKEVMAAGLAKVKQLNERYGAPIFNFVYRRRVWSDGEQCWLGHERKRGAILHFNDLLLGQTSPEDIKHRFRCETISQWCKDMLLVDSDNGHQSNEQPIRFVITLDTDTELVLYSAQKLIGAMAHPLNRPQLSADGRRVVSGYGIMQPRVNVDVEVTNKSRYAQLFAGLGGLDVYTTASFELYQDIFNEGTFCGKGIYDLQVFQKVLKDAFPDNLILSHDLIEGCHIRCGLINDVELFDDNPSNYLDDAKRHHRWTRGDWQIISWLGKRVHNRQGDRVKNPINTIGRWKIFDNLRRSVLSLAIVVAILAGFARENNGGIGSAWFVVAALLVVASPIVFFILGQVTKIPRFGRRYKYYMTLMRGFKVIIYRSLVQFALLPKEAWMYTDALVRSCWRMWVTHRNLLNWVTSDEAAKSTRGTMGEYLSKFWINYVVSLILVAVFTVRGGGLADLIAVVFCVVAWCCAPLLMYWLGKKFSQDKHSLSQSEETELKQIASDTWHFFDQLLTPDNHYLIPDNYQLNRETKTDYKTSPTNIGYSLTAAVSAAELGFLSHDEARLRIEHIIETVEHLEKWNGHLFNWYNISSLNKLPNYFISTADSGNFVACLYVVKGYLASRSGEDNLLSRVESLIVQTDFTKLYNPELDVFSIGYDYGTHTLLPYHYNNFASEARLTSFLTIAQGDAPYKHWFCLDKTLVQYKGYKGVASWYGTLFEYFMPLIFLPTYKHTLMDETYSFAIRAQRAFIRNATQSTLPWGISETAYNELDDAQNYKYQAFGVPYLKFQNTTPDRIVVSPYSSMMTIGVDDRAVYDNIHRFQALNMYDPSLGFFESYDEEDHIPVQAHYAHHQGMILASLANYLGHNCLQAFFMSDPVMRSMETLLKEKAQVKPYIDLRVTQYKRFQYSKVQTESDARDFDTIATVPEIGAISNGQYTVLLNDRGSGFSRYRNILLNRYRKISADHYGTYLFIRNLCDDYLWCNTYSPLDVMPDGYRVSFAGDKILFQRNDRGIETKTEVTVLKDRSAEIRRFTFRNTTSNDIDLELTTYGEVLLAPAAEDEAHRVFAGMKIISEFDADHQALLFSRPAPADSRYYLIHKFWTAESLDNSAPQPLIEYETSRINFLGRGGSIRRPAIIEDHRTLTGTVGTTLDPIMSLRRRLHIAAGQSAEAYIITGFAKAKEQLLQLTEQYRSPLDIEYAFETASVFNNMRTGLSLLKGAHMRLYNSISKYIVQTANLGNRRQDTLARNTLSQSGLWRFGISGDLAILLMEIDSLQRSGFAKELLRAFEYYKVRGLFLDVVFINDAPEHERDGLTHFIRSLADTEHLWVSHADAGHVYVLNGSDLFDAERILLRTVACLDFNTREGFTIQQQLENLEAANQHYQDKEEYPVLKPKKEFRVWSDLKYYNQYGGFDRDGRDYVVTNTNTPMPWVNIIANPHFGCVVSSTMAGFTFALNAQQFKLTAWSNDIVRDPASEMLLIDRHQFVPATARHGQGFSSFDADYDDLRIGVRLFVASERMEKYYQIKVDNLTGTHRTVQLDMVYKLVLGMTEEQTARYLYSTWDPDANAIRVRNVYHPIYRHHEVLLTCTHPLTDINLDSPNRKRIGLSLDLAPHATGEVAFIIRVVDLAQATLQPPIPSVEEIYHEFTLVEAYWDNLLSYIQVDTPDPSFNFMLNRWYLYQVYASRLFARAGFYQCGGATGYRDQLQDVMSALYSDPAYARRQILDHAAHQFPEGDVLHWWHESMHLGARTTFSDDYLWLPYVTYQYVQVTGDTSILSEVVPFCQADPLAPGEAERGMNYTASSSSATLYQHLRRSIARSMSRIGQHGLPLMGCGDWNDGMSRVGVEGKGESVWVAFFLCDILPKMQHLTQMMPDADLSYCQELGDFRTRLVEALQTQAWDGAWFLRAFYDNGTAMGSLNNTECQIDLISQAWSILTDVATDSQKNSIIHETDARLVDREHEIIRLLTPPFANSNPSPGYIMNYPEGIRENGGQYTHGAMWYIMAQLKEGRLDMGYFLYSLINPIHRTQTLADVLKYKVEPYCIAADIYSGRQHPGRGGWTWYTGSASWAYKTGIENILGLQKQADTLILNPRVPSEWDTFSVRYRYGNSLYHLCFQRSASPVEPMCLKLVDDAQSHTITIPF